MSDANTSSISSSVQLGSSSFKDSNLSSEAKRQSAGSIRSGATSKKSGSALSSLSDYYNPVAEKVQKTGNFISDFFAGFAAGLAFENGVSDVVYDI